MKIKSQKDFFSGLMFTVVGAAFAYGATSYTIGTGARMGPGYFPLLLGVILALGYKNLKKDSIKNSVWATMLGLTVLNVLLAYTW